MAKAKHNLQTAADCFGAAQYLAEDGSMVNAAILARRGCEHLSREWQRRRPLRAGTEFEAIALSEAIDIEIRRRKAHRRKAVA